MKFNNSVSRYFAALTTVLLAYLAYLQLVVPLIDGEPEIVPGTLVRGIGHTDPTAGLDHLFAPHAWERDECNVLETRQGKLLYQEYRQLDDGRIEITPLTLVVNPGGSDNQPFIIQSKSGAVLQFDRPFSLTGGMGELRNAILAGEVKIYRLSSTPHSDDSVEINTRNVEVSPNRIFTLSDVAFRFGGHHGRGRNLNIDLYSEAEQQGEPTPPIRGLELAQIDYIHIHSGPTPPRNPLDPLDITSQGAFDGPNSTPASDNQSSAEPGAEHLTLQAETEKLGAINITCDGSFTLDMENQVAAFKHNVHARAESGIVLQSDQLWLYFKNASAETRQSTTAPTNNPTNQPHTEPASHITPTSDDKNQEHERQDVHLSKLVAIGAPATLIAPERNAQVHANHLQFNLDTQRVVLRGGDRVRVQRDGETIVARELEYFLKDDGTPGDLIAEGPGVITRTPPDDSASKQPEFTCHWNGHLEFSDAPPTSSEIDQGLKLIQFHDRTTIEFDQSNRLTGDRIKFWLQEKSNPDATQAQADFLPHQLFAEGHVEIESDRLDGTADQLTVIWNQADNPALAHEPNQALGICLPPHPPRHGCSYLIAHTVSRAPYQDQAPTPIHYRFAGKQVLMHVSPAESIAENERQNGDWNSNVDDLTITGGVTIQQTNASGEQQPLAIRGDKLTAINLGANLFRISVHGSPKTAAFAAGRGLEMTGQVIHVDQYYNRLWIDGAGEALLQQQDDSRVTPDTTQISWSGGMVFDGQAMEFQLNVKTVSRQTNDDRSTSELETTSAGLYAQLTDKLNFRSALPSVKPSPDPRQTANPSGRNPAANSPEMKIEKIILVAQLPNQPGAAIPSPPPSVNPADAFVYVRSNERDSRGERQASRVIAVPTATLEPVSGDIQCSGPGLVQALQLSTGRSQQQLAAGMDPSTNRELPLDYVQVKFENSLTGNLLETQITFDGKVRTVYAPTDDWSTQLDADEPASQFPQAVRMSCDSLQLIQWKPRTATESPIEMIATGNAHATGLTFDAHADRIGFNDANKYLVLQSGARQDASIKYRKTAESRANQITAETIRYQIETGAVKVDGYKQIDVNQQGPILDRD